MNAHSTSIVSSNVIHHAHTYHGILPAVTHGRTRWVLQNNNSDLTLAVAANNKSYLIEDIDVFNWSLTDDDMHRLNTEPFAPEDPTRGTCKA